MKNKQKATWGQKSPQNRGTITPERTKHFVKRQWDWWPFAWADLDATIVVHGVQKDTSHIDKSEC